MSELKDILRGRGRITATAPMPDIDAYIRRVHGSPRPLTPKEASVIRTEVNAQMRVVRSNWPVETGTSRAGWTFLIRGGPGQVAVVYQNPVYYSGWVTKKGQTQVRDGGTPWYQKLVTQVWKANEPRLKRRLKEEIDKTERQIAKGKDLQQIGQNAPKHSTRKTLSTAESILRSIFG